MKAPLLVVLLANVSVFALRMSIDGILLSEKGIRVQNPPLHKYDVPNKEYVDAVISSSGCCPAGPMAINPATSVFACEASVEFDGVLYVYNATEVVCHLYLGAFASMDAAQWNTILHLMDVQLTQGAQVVSKEVNSTTMVIEFRVQPSYHQHQSFIEPFEMGVVVFGRPIQGKAALMHSTPRDTLLVDIRQAIHLIQDEAGVWGNLGQPLSSCKEYHDNGASVSGKYLLECKDGPGCTNHLIMMCDQEKEGGGWLVVYHLPFVPSPLGALVISSLDYLDSEGGWTKEDEFWKIRYDLWPAFYTSMRFWCMSSGGSAGDQGVVVDDTIRASLTGCVDASCTVSVGEVYLTDANELWTDDGEAYSYSQGGIEPHQMYFSRTGNPFCHFNIYPSTSVCECNNELTDTNDSSGKGFEILVR